MMILTEPYKPRPIRYLGLWSLDSWRLKVYGIAYNKSEPSLTLVDSARHIAQERIELSTAHANHYNVGFIGIHEGKTGNFVFIDWWADENELHHHIYTSPSERPQELTYMTPTGLAACTWDLSVMAFEREAWVKSMLKQYPEPDLEAYLNTILNSDI